MKIDFNSTSKAIKFGSAREDRNKIDQLSQSNNYSLTENNQRNISNAIKNFSANSDEQSIRFLIDTAAKLQYDTNIDLGKKSNNQWRFQLQQATKEALKKADVQTKKVLQEEYKRVFLEKKDLSQDEKELLTFRENILNSKIVKQALKSSKIEDINELPKNLDYFVISTETPIEEKKAVLGKLNFFLTPEYKLDPQLKGRKAEILSQILNDIVIKTPEHEILNTKKISQRTHGACGIFTIKAKYLAYEHKSKFVEQVMSELDSSDTMYIYDISKLGSGVKIPLKKPKIDYKYSEELDFRTIDAGTIQKMDLTLATEGKSAKRIGNYVAFDKKNFGIFNDGVYYLPFENKKLEKEHKFLVALIKAKHFADETKSAHLERNEKAQNQRLSEAQRLEEIRSYNKALEDALKKILKEDSKATPREIINGMLQLEKHFSVEKSKGGELAPFEFIENEENIVKQQKIMDFINYKAQEVRPIRTKKLSEKIFELYSGLKKSEKSLFENNRIASQRINLIYFENLFKTAAAYRVKTLAKLDIEKHLKEYKIEFNIVDDETRLQNNIASLIEKVKDPKETKITNILMGLKLGNSKEEIVQSLSKMNTSIKTITTKEFDSLLADMGRGSRHQAIYADIKDKLEKVRTGKRDELVDIAKHMNMPADKYKITQALQGYKKEVNNGITEARYIEILNALGHKNQRDFIISNFLKFQRKLKDETFLNKIAKQHKFKPEDKKDVDKFLDQMKQRLRKQNSLIEAIENKLNLKDKNLKPLTTINTKDTVTSILEKRGEILSKEQLNVILKRYIEAEQEDMESFKNIVAGENPKKPELRAFTKEEETLLKTIEQNLNRMHHNIEREYKEQYHILGAAYDQKYKEYGDSTGKTWVLEEGDTGVDSLQQIKLSEQLTGEEHYEEPDLKTGADKIKNGIHSGSSNTSVYHDNLSGHAQYIADIQPIEATDPKTGEKVVKDALMHDNTWGTREKSNYWVDSNGLYRGDYKKQRGGQKGFIIDKSWRNGTFIEDFINSPGKSIIPNVASRNFKTIKKQLAEENFSMFSGMVIPGNDASYQSSVAELIDLVFNSSASVTSSYNHFVNDVAKDGLGKKQATLTAEEKELAAAKIKKMMERIEDIPEQAEKTEKYLLKLIKGNEMVGAYLDGYGIGEFNKGISSVEDYEKLDKKHPLRMIIKKMALKDAYNIRNDIDELDRIKTSEELEKFEKKLPEIAKSDLKYLFGKNKDYLQYVYRLTYDQLDKFLQDLSVKYNFELNTEPEKELKNKKKVSEAKPKSISEQIGKIIEPETSKSEVKTATKKYTNSVLNKAFKNLFKQNFDGKLSTTINSLNENILGEIGANLQDKSSLPAIKTELEALTTPFLKKNLLFINENMEHSSSQFDALKKWIDKKYSPKTNEELVEIMNNILEMDNEDFQKLLQNMQPKDLGIKPTNEFEIIKHIRNNNYSVLDRFSMQIFNEEAIKRMQFSKTLKFNQYTKFEKNPLHEMFSNGQTLEEKYLELYFNSYLQKIKEHINKTKDEAFRLYKAKPSFPEYEPLIKEACISGVYGIVENFKTFIDKIKKLKDSDASEATLKQTLAEYNQEKSIFINQNIQTRYRAGIKELLNTWEKAYIRNDNKAQDFAEKLANAVYERNIVRNPIDIIKESIKAKKENTEKSKDLLKIYKKYFNEASNAGIASNIELSLKVMKAKGMTARLSSEIDNYHVPENFRVNAGQSLDTEAGFGQMIDELQNLSPDGRNFFWNFVKKAELEDKVFELETKTMPLEDYQKKPDEIIDKYKSIQKGMKIVKKAVQKSAANLSDPKVDVKSFEDKFMLEAQHSLQTRKVDNDSIISLIKMFIENFDSKIQQLPDTDLQNIFISTWNRFFNKVKAQTNQQFGDKLSNLAKEVSNKLEYLGNLQFENNKELAQQKTLLTERLYQLKSNNDKVLNKFLKLLKSFA